METGSKEQMEKLCKITEVPLYAETLEGDKEISFPGSGTVFEADRRIRILLKEKIQAAETPILYAEDECYAYGAFGAEGCLFFLGPFCFMKPLAKRAKDYEKKHGLSGTRTYPVWDADKIAEYLSYLYRGISGKEIPSETIAQTVIHEQNVWNPNIAMEQYEMERSEKNETHGDSEYERRLLERIASGDVEGVRKVGTGEVVDKPAIGTVARSGYKQMEYLAVTMIALACRTAVKGGMNPVRAYNMSDLYLQQIEKCRTVSEISAISGGVCEAYARCVKEAKEKRSRQFYVEACKDYIMKNLRKNIVIAHIAPRLGVSVSYLDRKFREEEGMTIQQYIAKERCEHAANLLKYTAEPISLISEYFCFSSQSYFGKQFKKYMGETPLQYRLRNHYSSGGIF